MATFDLAKTLKVNEDTYNISAVSAGKVENALTLKKALLTTASEEAFDGSEKKELYYVPATGGAFTGNIRVPKNAENKINDDAVLNYKDLVTNVFNKVLNNSILYSWNGKETDTVLENDQLNSISVIRGAISDIDSFAKYNYQNKALSAYIYIGTSESGDGGIFFGTSNEEEAIEISVGSAASAVKLENARTIRTNLAKSEAAEFDGSKNIEPGIKGVLPAANGGTGKSNLANVTVGNATNALKAEQAVNATSANQLANNPKITVNLGTVAANGTAFNGSNDTTLGITGTLSASYGGTGKTNLDDVTVGSAKKIATYTSGVSTASPSKYARIIVTSGSTSNPSGNDGDIWIKLT